MSRNIHEYLRILKPKTANSRSCVGEQECHVILLMTMSSDRMIDATELLLLQMVTKLLPIRYYRYRIDFKKAILTLTNYKDPETVRPLL